MLTFVFTGPYLVSVVTVAHLVGSITLLLNARYIFVYFYQLRCAEKTKSKKRLGANLKNAQYSSLMISVTRCWNKKSPNFTKVAHKLQ